MSYQEGVTPEDEGNSSLIALTSGSTFTGAWIRNTEPDVLVSCKASHNGVLYFDFSNDGVNVDSFPVAGFTVTAGIHEFHSAVKGPRYYRTRFTNSSASTQTYFRLYTYYGTFRQSNAPINSVISSDVDAVVVRTVSSELDLAFGNFDGLEEGAKFGMIDLLDAADAPATIWAFGSDDISGRVSRIPFQSTATTLYLTSSSAADTSRSFSVEYIDATGARVTETVLTNASSGQTPVVFAASNGLHVNRIFLNGNNQTHAGNIYIAHTNNFTSGVPNSPSTDVTGFIEAGYGQTQQAAYIVPAGFKQRIKLITLLAARASGASGSAEIQFRVKPSGGSWRILREYEIQTGETTFPVFGVILDAGTKWEWVLNDVSDTDTNVTAEIAFELKAI